MTTIRKQIISLLEQKEYGARSISQHLGIREKEVYDHIPHIMKTVSAMGKTLTVIAAQCNTCDYKFKKRKKVTKPGRCPICKNERIDPPRFRIN